MIPLERKDKILELLNTKKFMSIKELADRIYVSQMTVRRDLRQLEKEGIIHIRRGGAEIVEHTHDSNANFSYALRKTLNAGAKKEIAYKAFLRIQPGDTVFIDSSSTATFIAEYLFPEMNVTVVTNSLQTANLLAEKGITFYLIGGCYNDISMAFFGSTAENCADRFKIDKMFFSSQGVVEDEYIYGSNENETLLRQLFIKRSEKKYFLCDTNKMGKKFLFRVCRTSDVDEIISNKALSTEVSQ